MKLFLAAVCSLLLFTPTPTKAAADEAGFVSIFNGKDLTGWDGKPSWWEVEDGALTAQSTPEKPCKECNYLIWRGGQPADFELRADFKLSRSANSGIITPRASRATRACHFSRAAASLPA